MLNKVEIENGWALVESYMDSGAARSVCPRSHCAGFDTVPSNSSRQNEHFKTASGARIANEGDRNILGQSTQGELLSMRYAVADVTQPLDSVAQMCDAGAVVVFTAHGGYINGPRGRIAFERRDDTYVRKTWVRADRLKKKTGTTQTQAAAQTPPKNTVDADGDVVMNRVVPTRGFQRPGTAP